MLVPILDEVIAEAAEAGMRQAFIGMAHRGRLNVMAHVLGKPYEQILAEFKDPVRNSLAIEGVQWSGDVKYHLGASRMVAGGEAVALRRLDAAQPEPPRGDRSGARRHGARRRARTRGRPGAPVFNPDAVLPILIHGDAAFSGQGVVAETLNLHRLDGYTTGGTIHIIANNQIGFTTEPHDAYSTLYASGLARAFKIPIVHVNADDPEACVAAARLAFGYREQFKRDFLIDLVGYRRYGHNEGDEPAFTQPMMYREDRRAADGPADLGAHARSARHDPGRSGRRDAERAARRPAEAPRGARARETLRRSDAGDCGAGHGRRGSKTAVALERLRALNASPARDARRVSPCIASSSAGREKRRQAFDDPDRPYDRLGRRRGAGVRLDSRGRHADPAHRRGRRARHVQPSPRRPLRRGDGTALLAARIVRAGDGVVRDSQQPAQRERGRRVRVRLQRAGARAAGDLGSAVRRLHQRRAAHARRVRAVGARQVGAGAVARHAAAARLRRPGAGPRQRPPGTLSRARRRHQPAARQLHHGRAVLSPAAAPGGAA